jgi:NADH-quinone oxidoreductase subunit E
MAVFDAALRAQAEQVKARYPAGRERSAIMPLLYLAQSVEGHVSREGMREVGELLAITTAEVEAVASFYTMLRLRETGTHVVSVCTNLSCALVGANEVYEAANQAAGIAHGEELSGDKTITLHEEECLGCCELAPVVQVNAANHDRVTPERMREIVEALRRGEVPEPARGPAIRSFKQASRILAGVEVPS